MCIINFTDKDTNTCTTTSSITIMLILLILLLMRIYYVCVNNLIVCSTIIIDNHRNGWYGVSKSMDRQRCNIKEGIQAYS